MLVSKDSVSPGAMSPEISTSSGGECSTLTVGKVLLFRQLSEVLLKQLISRTLTAEHSSADVQLAFYTSLCVFCTTVLTLRILDRFPFNGTILSRFAVCLNIGFVRSFLLMFTVSFQFCTSSENKWLVS